MLNNELDVIKFWNEEKIFEKSLSKNKTGPTYVFLDGPPFVTGLPHFGHLSTGYPKDIFPRYWTQKGYYAPRRWGWDCHGLPIENMVQKQLGVTDKRQIENEIGIDKFNATCRQNILGYDIAWREVVNRSGRWVDMDDQYRTMDNEYIESVWWGLGRLWEKGLLYKDYRVSMYSPSMGATLSHMEIADDVKYVDDHLDTPIVRFRVTENSAKKLMKKIMQEVALSYSEQMRYKLDLDKRISTLEKLDDKSRKTNLKDLLKSGRPEFSGIEWDNFKTDLESEQDLEHLKEQLEVVHQNIDTLEKLKNILSKDYPLNILSWTTTPWTLPANVALAVGAEIEYSIYYLPASSELVILAENRAIPTLSLHFKDAVINSPELQASLREITDGGEYFRMLGVGVTKVVSLRGADLEGLEYKSLFELTQKIDSYEESANIFKVYTSDFVTSEEGTGVLHIAPAYGAEDFEIRKQRNLPVLTCLNDYGEIRNDLDKDLRPVYGKNFEEANPLINEILYKKGLLFSQVPFVHKYPVFSRDGKKVYYNAQENWYIGETRLLEKSLDLNEQINWYPEHLKHGRFENGLRTAPDWCISRNRYWGSPIPIWQTADGSKTIFIDSLEKLRTHAINPIYRLLNTRDYNTDYYEEGKVVIFTDAQTKLPLGISAAQFRSKSLTELRKEKALDIQKFAVWAQPILDEIFELFEKYHTVQLLFNDEEQNFWTTWLYGLHPASKKVSRVFYFYRQVREDFDTFKPYGQIKMLDLHRPFIDDILLKDEVDNIYRRIPDVVDNWVESGAMPWASYHYPFENKDFVEKNLPADYIVEYEGQIRGWFHALHILSTGIFGKPAFKNVHVHGTLLGYDGKKMSKSKGNFGPTEEYFNKYGSDALRLYFTMSPYFIGETLAINDKDMQAIFRDSTLLLSNSIKYIDFVLKNYWQNTDPTNFKHPLNKWWQIYTQDYAKKLVDNLDKYNLMEAARMVIPYIDTLSTWYIRRSKDLLSTYGTEVAACLQQTMHLFAQVTAALQPFNMERLWSVIRRQGEAESVHLTNIPEVPALTDKQEQVLEKMDELRHLVSQIHSVRKERQIRVRQPLYADFSAFDIQDDLLLDLLTKECNLLPKDLSKTEGEIWENHEHFGFLKIDLVVDKDLSVLGFSRDFERAVQEFRKKQGMRPGQVVTMRWQIAEVVDEEIWANVLKNINWDKLLVEVKWVEDLDLNSKKIEVKDLVTILVD
jgi:isoleucyl-tRNA synthetase